MIRLVPNQSGLIERAEMVQFTFDGMTVQGHDGETVVAALMRAGHMQLRSAPQDAGPRGAFCCMGLCQECAVRIDNQIVEACRVDVTPDLSVERAG